MSTQGYGATGLAGGPFTVSNPPPGKRFGSFINGRKQIIWLQARTTLAAAMSAARSGNPVTPEDVAVPEVDEQELPSGSSSALGGKCGPVASATGDSRPTATAGAARAVRAQRAARGVRERVRGAGIRRPEHHPQTVAAAWCGERSRRPGGLLRLGLRAVPCSCRRAVPCLAPRRCEPAELAAQGPARLTGEPQVPPQLLLDNVQDLVLLADHAQEPVRSRAAAAVCRPLLPAGRHLRRGDPTGKVTPCTAAAAGVGCYRWCPATTATLLRARTSCW